MFFAFVDSSPQGGKNWLNARLNWWNKKDSSLVLTYIQAALRKDTTYDFNGVQKALGNSFLSLPVVLGSGHSKLHHELNAFLHQFKTTLGCDVKTLQLGCGGFFSFSFTASIYVSNPLWESQSH